jgi:hypothetical protein
MYANNLPSVPVFPPTTLIPKPRAKLKNNNFHSHKSPHRERATTYCDALCPMDPFSRLRASSMHKEDPNQRHELQFLWPRHRERFVSLVLLNLLKLVLDMDLLDWQRGYFEVSFRECRALEVLIYRVYEWKN